MVNAIAVPKADIASSQRLYVYVNSAAQNPVGARAKLR
jgi:hypothetical protein